MAQRLRAAPAGVVYLEAPGKGNGGRQPPGAVPPLRQLQQADPEQAAGAAEATDGGGEGAVTPDGAGGVLEPELPAMHVALPPEVEAALAQIHEAVPPNFAAELVEPPPDLSSLRPPKGAWWACDTPGAGQALRVAGGEPRVAAEQLLLVLRHYGCRPTKPPVQQYGSGQREGKAVVRGEGPDHTRHPMANSKRGQPKSKRAVMARGTSHRGRG